MAESQLVGWACVASVDGVALALSGRNDGVPAAVRVAHQAYDAGIALAAGVASLAAVELWHRYGPRRPRLGIAALAAVALVLGGIVLGDDLGVLATSTHLPREIARAGLVTAFASTIPCLAALTLWALRRAKGPSIARIAVAFGLALAAANHVVLARDYDGVHLFLSWAPAVAIACAVGGRAVQAPHDGRRRALGGLACAALVGAGALAVKPSNALALDVLRANGGRLAPWLLRARRAATGAPASIPSAWLADRRDRPSLPPSWPPLLPKGAIVLFVTIDALRADVVAAPENASRFPALAALQRESVVFAQARSVAPATVASLASVFAGKYFSQLDWTPLPDDGTVCPHDDSSIRFPDALAAASIATAIVTGLPGLRNAVGVVRGFTEETFVPGQPWATAAMIGERLIARARLQGEGPLFLYAHLTDPHAPYMSAAKEGTDYERYLSEVALVDAEIGRIREALSAPELRERVAFIVSADHGEAFGEHGTRYHSTTVYEELLRVPLIVRVPGTAPRVIDDAVSLIDVGPTVLDLMGVATPATFMGQSLTPYLRGAHPRLTRPLVAESSRGKVARISGPLKVIEDMRAGTCEVYDLARDPGELENLADQGGPAAEPCAELEAFRSAHELRRPGYTTPFVR